MDLTRIAEAKMDAQTRKRYASDFIQERIDDLPDRKVTDENIEDEIRPYKDAYDFSKLFSVYDSREDDFDVKGNMSPEDEIASRNSPWPTGRQQDPVPIRWFRRGDVYPTIKIYENNEDGERVLADQGTILAGITLPLFRSKPSRRLQVSPLSLRPIEAMQKGPRGSESVKDEVRDRLKLDPNIEVVEDGGTVLSGSKAVRPYYAIDHVRELTLGGDDAYTNLWPVRSSINSAFNANFNQAIRIQDSEKIDEALVKTINTKWVKVDDVAEAVPRTSGGHGTIKGTLPINRGRLSGGVRKKFPRPRRRR